jgi:small subunit ribosomal protein S20
MANIRSSEKSIRQTKVRTLANKSKRTRVRTLRRSVMDAVKAGDLGKAEAALSSFAAAADKAAKGGALAKNTASRLKGRLATRVGALSKK